MRQPLRRCGPTGTLIGGAHMLFADGESDPPEAVGKVVNAVIADIVQ
ncbi:hypothetical protein [Nonomuraea sp. NPDC048916]